MLLKGFIARRYLFARKSHNVINIISMISAAGIAVGCAALIIILSVYNGFDSLVRSLFSSQTPDLLVEPASGRTFDEETFPFDALNAADGVKAVSGVLQENVYLQYGERRTVAVAKGVDTIYRSVSGLADYICEGKFELTFGSRQEAVVGRTLALELGIRPAFTTSLELWYPSSNRDFALIDPSAALRKAELFPSGIVTLEQGFDKKYVFVPLGALQELTAMKGRLSAVEIFAEGGMLNSRGVARESFRKEIEEILGEGFRVKDRYMQNDTIYKLLVYEKLAIYAILLFVIIIIAANISSSLTMLIIEKRGDVQVLSALGADRSLTKGIFVTEGWMISALGIAAGVIAGLAVCFLQQRLGIVRMPGNFIVDAYPVEVRITDVLLTVAGVGVIGYLASLVVRK